MSNGHNLVFCIVEYKVNILIINKLYCGGCIIFVTRKTSYNLKIYRYVINCISA